MATKKKELLGLLGRREIGRQRGFGPRLMRRRRLTVTI